MVTDRRGFLFLLFIFYNFVLFGEGGAEGSLSMTCMKLNRKPSKPNPRPCNCVITLNNNNDEENKSRSPLFSFKALYFYTRCWSQTVRAFGRNLYINVGGVGGGGGLAAGTDCFPFRTRDPEERF